MCIIDSESVIEQMFTGLKAAFLELQMIIWCEEKACPCCHPVGPRDE